MQKPIMEGFLAGGATLIVVLLWWILSPFHALIVYALYLIGLLFLSIATLWLLAKEMTLNDWFSELNRGQMVMVYILGLGLAGAPLVWILLEL